MTRTAQDDRQAIADLIHIYCRSVDRLDVPLGHSIWHDDATADYGKSYYQGPGKGVIDRICADHAGLLGHVHQIGNILIALDGDKAGSESYCTATLRMQRGDDLVQMQVWTRYADTWSRRGGRWGLDHRTAIREFDEVRSVRAMASHDVSRRDASDPSYAALAIGVIAGASA